MIDFHWYSDSKNGGEKKASIAEMAKATAPREFDLSREWTLDEVNEKLTARASAFQMPFSVKGGIGGDHIVFPTEDNLDVQ